MSAVDWRNLPTVIVTPNKSPSSTDAESSEKSNDDDAMNEESNEEDQTSTESDDVNRDDSDQSDDEQKERREKRRAKHIAKIQEKFGDYLSDSGSSISLLTNHTDSLQTVPYRAPRRTLGCPHWRCV